MRPTDDIAACAASHATLDVWVARIDEATARRPSLLPEWSVAHVLAHLAANADSVIRRLEGAMANEVVDQYPGGPEGRAREIAEVATLPVADLRAYVRSSSVEVDRLFAAMPDNAWARVSRGVQGGVTPAHRLAYSRWREVELHLVDLGIGYTMADVPDALLERTLPELLPTLPERANARDLVGWLTGRSAAPDLAPWG